MFSFLMSAHIRNSSQLTQGTVIEAAEGFLESLFLAKANSEPIVRVRESEDQRSAKRQSGMMERPSLACMNDSVENLPE